MTLIVGKLRGRALRRVVCGLVAGIAVIAAWRVTPARTEAEGPFGSFVETEFPFITSTVDAGSLGPAFPERNLSIRCVVVMLGNRTYACFDTDLLRMAVVWKGDFLSLTGVAQVSYDAATSKAHAVQRIQGSPILTTGIYPGWSGPDPDFKDPRPLGPYAGDVGRGPVSTDIGRWSGLHVVDDRVVLSYDIRGTSVIEQPATVEVEGETAFVRAMRVGPVPAPLTMVVAEVGASSHATGDRSSVLLYQGAARDSVTAVTLSDAPRGARMAVEGGRYVVLHLPASARSSEFRVLVWRGASAKRHLVNKMAREEVEIADYARGGSPRWPGTVTTAGRLSPDTAAHVVDQIALPIPNPWKRNVRAAGMDYFSDGRAAVVTFDGDVWIVSGLDRDLREVRWKRFSSGAYEPLSLQVVDDQIYVFGREGVVRPRDVNGDSEADYYENFSNLIIQSGESREFPMDLVKKPGGGFYAALGGALDNGPKTSPQLVKGFRAGSRHSGTVVEISPDGRQARTIATGLREPFIGVHPRTGMVTASDQQGNFVPATPLFIVREGSYYGVPATAHREDVPTPASPLLWIPHAVDQSAASQVWVTDPRMGLAPDALIHLSYGRPGPFLVLVDSVGAAVQGAIVPFQGPFTIPTLKGAVNPIDGQLYLSGFQIWGSTAKEISGILRLRYTGKPLTLPSRIRGGVQGVAISFPVALDSATALDPGRYRVQRWNYVRTEEYGSGHYKLDGSPGQERLPVSAHLSADRRTVLLVAPGMRDVMQVQIDYDLRSAEGARVANTAYLTLDGLPELNLPAYGFGSLDWRASASRAARAAVAASAASSPEGGAATYQRIGCTGCHSVDGTTEGRVGPTFRGLYGSVRRFTDGSNVRAFEDYLRQSILHPGAKIVTGFQEGMPSYVGVLTDAEIESLILYIKSLGGEATAPAG